MSPVIRINDEIYARLESLAHGFDTPASVIDRLIDAYVAQNSAKHTQEADIKPAADTNLNQFKSELKKPELVFEPSDEAHFRKLLLEKKKATVTLHKSDGREETKLWNASKFSESSNLRANIWSGFLRNWQRDNIVKAELSIIAEYPRDNVPLGVQDPNSIEAILNDQFTIAVYTHKSKWADLLLISEDGTGYTGDWLIRPYVEPKVVIIYVAEEDMPHSAIIYRADITSIEGPMKQYDKENRFRIHFNNAQEVMTTDLNWKRFASTGSYPVKYFNK